MRELAAVIDIPRFQTVPLLSVLTLGDSDFIRFSASDGSLAVGFFFPPVRRRLAQAPALFARTVAGSSVTEFHTAQSMPGSGRARGSAREREIMERRCGNCSQDEFLRPRPTIFWPSTLVGRNKVLPR